MVFLSQLMLACASLLLLQCTQAFVVSEKCYWNNYCPYNYFSTKTYYDAIRGDIRDTCLDEFDACSPLALWSLNRHGTRNAGRENTDEMKTVSILKEQILSSHAAGTSQLCNQDIENLRTWAWNDDLDTTVSYLTESGFNELKYIGRRLREKYPQLLFAYDESKFYFRPTSEQRTTMSSIAFVTGLFGENSSAIIDSPRDIDETIRPYENCDRWQTEVKDNPQRLVQPNAYYETTDFKKVTNRIQTRLGIEYQLTPDNVTALYNLCRFNKSSDPSALSPWCALFNAQDLVIIEYLDDLLHYYRNGYGSELNAKLGATALKNLYETFEHAKTNEESKVVAYFTHDTMMEMVFSAMGIFKDRSDLMANDRRPDRKWRTTYISPFATNLVAVMYRCENGEHSVVFHVNEKPIEVCRGASCTWDEFEDKFKYFSNADLTFCKL